MKIESRSVAIPTKIEPKINPIYSIKKELPKRRFLFRYKKDIGIILDISI